jgi:diguanylate cyclase (GGDEF)-like protein/PAS domain S-box-containing protein
MENKFAQGLPEMNPRIFEAFAETSGSRYLFMCNLEQDIARWSKNAVEYFGLEGEYLDHASKKWRKLIHPDDRRGYMNDILELMRGHKDKFDMKHRVLSKHGEYVLCSAQAKILYNEEGIPQLMLGTIKNHGIADTIDPATNLYNIYEFIDHMKMLRENMTDAIELLIGLNSFSEINDIYGYEFGDRVLKHIGARIQEAIGKDVKLYRMNGVRFACFFCDDDINHIYDIYRRIQYLLKYNVVIDGIRVPVSTSAGAVVLTGNYDEFAVQGSARYALEQSKTEHHGELYVFDDSMTGTKKKKLELISALRKAMMNSYEGFYMCYQPLVSSQEEDLLGAEALLRWKSPEFGEVSPGVFIPLLENDPSFFELGNWILRRSLSESMPMIRKFPEFILNVNISYAQLSHPLFRISVKSILNETGFPADHLCMELTESCRQLEKEYLTQEIEHLTSLGIRIAIDDFGTGYSSLNLITDLPVETLKFDRSFTKNIMTNTVNQSIIKAVSTCAKELKVHICLEGMETREMIDFVKQFCIHSYQGYYYSKPIVMTQFKERYG